MGTQNSRLILSAVDRASASILKVRSNLKLLGTVAGFVGATMVGRKMVQGLRDAVATYARFEKALADVNAVMGATEGQMARLEKQAKDLGRTTVFTATQTAEAQFLLAKAGFDAEKTLAAIPGTLALAAAGDLELSRATDIAAQALSAFQLEASAMGDVSDLLAKAANTANTSVEELGEAFKFASPASKSLGVSMTEMTAAIQIASNAGLKGSLAGTGLAKTFTTILGNVNKLEGASGLEGLEEQLFTTEGKFVGLSKALEIMAENGINSSTVYKAFGERAGKVADILLRNREELAKNVTMLKDRYGSAAEVAHKRLDALAGDQEKFKAALEGAKLAIGGQLAPALRVLTQQLSLVLNAFTDTAEGGNMLTTLLSWVGAAFRNVGTVALTVADFMQKRWRALSVGFNALMSVLSAAFEGFLDLLIRGMTKLNFRGMFDDAIAQVQEFRDNMAYTTEAFVDNALLMADAAAETSANIAKMKAEFALINARDGALEDLVIPEGEAGAADAGSGGVVSGKGGDDKLSPDEQTKMEEEAAEIRLRIAETEYEREKALREQAAADALAQLEIRQAQEIAAAEGQEALLTELRQRHLMERAEMEAAQAGAAYGTEATTRALELLALQHEAEMAALGENELAKTELLRQHELERQLLREEMSAEELAAKRELELAKLTAEQRAAAEATKTKETMNKQGMAILGKFFGGVKAFTIAEIILSTKRSISNALAVPPSPNIPLGALAAARGAAELATAKKQKFQFGGMARKLARNAGVAFGPGGVDQVSANLTAGELVADTTSAEARAILGGRAAIVPVGSGGAGARVIIQVQGDVIDADAWATRNAQSLGRALQTVLDDGGVI